MPAPSICAGFLMSDQAPIVAISSMIPASFSAALADTRMFPIIEAGWSEALDAVARVQPVAVVASVTEADMPVFGTLARRLAAKQPYVPLIAIDPTVALPINALPFTQSEDGNDRLGARLRNALRVRSLHSTVLRRLSATDDHMAVQTPDPIEDVTLMLIGRGAAYPALSVAIGERVGVVGALSIEAAAKHLNTRDLDGIIIADGFSERVVDAFLTVLTEDSRFRNLPVIVQAPHIAPIYDLPNLEIMSGEASELVNNALPLARQHALEARLTRMLTSLDTNGLLDSRTGLLTTEAFHRDFATAVYHTQSRGGGLAAVRFTFDTIPDRTRMDAARILSRLMRKIDYGTVLDDGSIIIVLAETDLRSAHMIAKRLSSVMKHTMHSKRDSRSEPSAEITAMLPDDSMGAMIERLRSQGKRRAAS